MYTVTRVRVFPLLPPPHSPSPLIRYEDDPEGGSTTDGVGGRPDDSEVSFWERWAPTIATYGPPVAVGGVGVYAVSKTIVYVEEKTSRRRVEDGLRGCSATGGTSSTGPRTGPCSMVTWSVCVGVVV